MRCFLLSVLLYLLLAAGGGCTPRQHTSKSAEAELSQISLVLQQQQNAWNTGDLEAYMQGYWQSDSLSFIGSKGLTYGWQQTLANYKRSYPDKAAMGKLTFTILQRELLSAESAYVVGKWHLKRDAGDLQGHFSLLWRKVNGRWVIVSDHSS